VHFAVGEVVSIGADPLNQGQKKGQRDKQWHRATCASRLVAPC